MSNFWADREPQPMLNAGLPHFLNAKLMVNVWSAVLTAEVAERLPHAIEVHSLDPSGCRLLIELETGIYNI